MLAHMLADAARQDEFTRTSGAARPDHVQLAVQFPDQGHGMDETTTRRVSSYADGRRFLREADFGNRSEWDRSMGAPR
jgi:hypothetical protein